MVLSLIAIVAALSVSAQEKSQVFRAGVDVVSLNVTVVDGAGYYVTDLAMANFRCSKTASNRN